MENTIDFNAFNSLSEEEKEIALEILRQYSAEGKSSILEGLKYDDFEEIPVDIDTFLDDDEYLGKGIWEVDKVTGERRCTLFPYWRDTLKKLFPDNLTTAYNTLILTGAIGLGKAQPMDAQVLTECGFKRMGDIQLLDKVFGNDGQLHNILGIFPQGKKKICKVSFTDGTSTLCCDEHLWTVYDIKKQRWLTVETKELLAKGLKQSTGHRYKIPMTAPINFEKKTLDIHPYILGVLIGDGSLTQAPEFACAQEDSELITYIKQYLPKCLQLKQHPGTIRYSITSTNSKNNLKAALKQYNLNTVANKKHIPTEYLHTSVEDRILLLQGLMDTNGTIDKNGNKLMFITISEQLKNDFIWLVQSLGGICHLQTKKAYYKDKLTNKKIYGQNAYYIGIKLPKAICPFKLQRKIARLNDKALEPFRYITDIEYVGEDECQCIYIDSKEHLYLTNDFIVTHNTLVAVLAQLYLLYRMLCLKDPYAYYGMMPMDKITFSMLNVNLETAKGVGWDKLEQLVQLSPWFMAHGELNASRVNPTWQPDKHIELIFGSNNNHVVGRALFSNLSDEVNFAGGGNDVERKKAKLKKMIAQIDARMVSRFGKGTFLPTLNIIVSSKDVEQAFLNSYIDTKRKNESKTTLIIDEPQWVIRNDKGTPDDPGAFYVAIGGRFLAHELLPVDADEELVESYRAKGYVMLKVPPIYREDFETNLDQALMDDAGYSISNSTKYISGVRLNEAKVDTYRNPFTKDIIEVGNAPDDYAQYANFFDLSAVSPEDLSKPLFIHLDMSTGGYGKGDKTGIAGTWITGKVPTAADNTDSSLDLRYKLAFSVSIKAPKGYQISFEKTRNFIRWLRDQGFAIKCITSDTYMAGPVQQELKADGFKTEILSVDRVDTQSRICVPYNYLKSAIYERRVQIYRKCDLLTDELIGLERMSSGKIDHTPDGINSKDQADAFCGSLYTASKYSEEYAYNYGENLDASLEINGTLSDAQRKTQMILDFQKELTSVYQELDEVDAKKNQNSSWQAYQDAVSGILVI